MEAPFLPTQGICLLPVMSGKQSSQADLNYLLGWVYPNFNTNIIVLCPSSCFPAMKILLHKPSGFSSQIAHISKTFSKTNQTLCKPQFNSLFFCEFSPFFVKTPLQATNSNHIPNPKGPKIGVYFWANLLWILSPSLSLLPACSILSPIHFIWTPPRK